MAVPSESKPSSGLSSDPFLAPFLSPTFSPTDYLNATLPTWTPSTTTTTHSASLADITTQTQATVTQLNAQLTRLSATLTGLTDDILRAGGRLAYEVELLRGDASSLSDSLAEGLRDDLRHFAPDQPPAPEHPTHDPSTAPTPAAQAPPPQDPDHATARAVVRLHTLTLVRERLDAVVRVFGDAMAWPLAPSDAAGKTSFIAVAGPDGGAEAAQRERRGKEHAERLRSEIGELVGAGTDEGELAALRRLEELRGLAEVWRGTSEERGRLKIVEGLAKVVEERKRGGGRSGYGLGAELPVRGGQGRA